MAALRSTAAAERQCKDVLSQAFVELVPLINANRTQSVSDGTAEGRGKAM